MTVLDYLENSAARFPDKTAFFNDDSSITYSELLKMSRRIASQLIHELNCIRRPVAVLVDRNVESIVSFMGVAASRNFYVPIDQSLPLNRIRVILEQMQPAAMIDTGDFATEEIRELLNIPLLRYADLTSEEEEGELLAEVRKHIIEEDPLFAICTSGSTGVPKGVVKSHHSVLAFMPVFADTFGLTENEVFGNQAPFDFDVSAKDIYSTLYLGASTYIIPRICFVMPKKLVIALDENRISTIIWSVSALCVAAGVNAFKARVPMHLKKVLFSGEIMPVKMLNVWRKYIPDAMYVNLYGPTECTGNTMYYIIDREFENTDKIPLGVPFANQQVLVLNEKNEPIRPGESGEIYLCSPSLALGYYRNPEKTAGAFVQNPLNDCYPERVFRTGDMAELSPEGEYYFAARKDFQIKHMGHRIELEEIETFMGAIDRVTRVCCLYDVDRNKIIACYSGNIERGEITEELKKDLPKYMIPNIFVQMENLPLNKNGKIDRARLREEYLGK